LIFQVARTALLALRRDRGALVLSFVLPLAFFSIFATIFGKQNDTTPKVKVILVDEDRSEASRDLVNGLKSETSLVVMTRPRRGARKRRSRPITRRPWPRPRSRRAMRRWR